MFRQAPDSMIPDPTPERVFSLCRLLAYQSMSREELVEALSLGKPSKTNYSEIGAALSVAQNDLWAVRIQDGVYQLTVAPEVVQSPDQFRRFVASKAFTETSSRFVLFTRWYIAQNEGVFTINTWEARAKTAEKEVAALKGLRENDALGWRFWAAFLGIGYLSGTALIPNMKQRLADVFAAKLQPTFSYGEPILAKSFFAWLDQELPEVDLSQEIPMAVSAGLRTLHELGAIQLESRRDTEKVFLYYVSGDQWNTISHITVKEESGR